ncbi:hypothetical protein [Mycolicibacterium smegmatis]|uniref:hypothetical protein n=1 Tax=Mycolicibacterium smegmatis TaxID=1772 RepID=UPI001EFB7DAB|nr:hypothetical protein [Mycolicibacterium smegmatis]ULN33616.1 hypothetical protein KZ781_22760 [Mycolicibacterium smegmatis]
MADDDQNDLEEQPDASESDDRDVTPDDEHGADDGTYPAKIVKDLRKENASYRERARTAEARADDLARQLFRLRVDATGKLASADDLPFDADLLADDDKLNAAVDELIAKHPHYAKRRATGSIGQGERGHESVPQDFSSLLRS